MTTSPVTAWSPPVSPIDQLLQFWMLPVRLGLDLVQSSSAMLLAVAPRTQQAVEKASETVQDVAHTSVEQVAHIDDGAPTMPTPAGPVG